MAEKNLFEWAEKQADWRRDALRRHAKSSSFVLDETDKAAIVAHVKKAAGLEQNNESDQAPLDKDHLNIEKPAGPKALLVSLGPVKNLARIAKGQQLRFGVDGLTVIYGDNATGKSGYCRITKKVCRSQTSDELLGDVFIDGPKPPAEVLIRFMHEGDEKPSEAMWKDGTAPPKAVTAISVFDSRNARFYIDQQNRVEFLPPEISLLESHGGHCREMQAGFTAERALLEQRISVGLPLGFTPGGAVATLLGTLKPRVAPLPTADKLAEMAAWTEDDKAELDALAKTLAQNPAALASRDDRAKAALGTVQGLLPRIETELSASVATDLKTKFQAADEASKAAEFAVHETFAGEPLPSVGSDPWRLMYEHAKAYVKAAGIGSEVPSDVGDLCALCQEPLTEAASARLMRFNDYIAGETAKKKSEAKANLETARGKLLSLSILEKEAVSQALAEYAAAGTAQSQLTTNIENYLEAGRKRRAELQEACDTGEFSKVTTLPVPISERVQKEIAKLQESADGFRDKAKLDTMRAQSVSRQNELKDRELLHNVLDVVLARRSDLERHAKISKCEQLVDTQQLSTFITGYRRELFTESLQSRIQAEIDGLDLGHIPFAVVDRSKEGKSEFKVGIKAKIPVANDKVLSEGEQRALALACFLAEAAGDEVRHGMVIDDPVSSLDHVRIRRVAKRLVAEASKGRQVIVFTHNLLFYHELLREAAAAEPQVPTARRIISKNSTDGFGLVAEDIEPWSARKVTGRISDLRSRRSVLEAAYSDFDSEDYRRAAKDFYTDLRETWERLVETLLLGTVVERYNSDVKTQSLKAVEVDDEDYRTVFHAMKKVSERSGHDMAAAKQVPIPTPTDMKVDLEVIDAFREKITKRSKITEERRKQQEGPPSAKVIA